MDSPPTRYTRTAMALHWLIAFAVFGQIAFGWYLELIPLGAPPRAAAAARVDAGLGAQRGAREPRSSVRLHADHADSGLYRLELQQVRGQVLQRHTAPAVGRRRPRHLRFFQRPARGD